MPLIDRFKSQVWNANETPNFERLVLICVEADLCKCGFFDSDPFQPNKIQTNIPKLTEAVSKTFIFVFDELQLKNVVPRVPKDVL